ncbi:unnamed protein product [Effrenium voratum]|nr:unnamed protein product [Effrenium voratum]
MQAPAIIFIDELDAIGQKRSGGGELSGVREVQRTMLELLNQLDGFTNQTTVKIIAATNRPDTLDPALLRSGRLDRKIELPHPNEDGRRSERAGWVGSMRRDFGFWPWKPGGRLLSFYHLFVFCVLVWGGEDPVFFGWFVFLFFFVRGGGTPC